jgi:uncharacterized protein (TIGR03066 family)
MSMLRLALVCCLVATAAVGQAREDKKIDKAKLVGTWKIVKSTPKGAAPSSYTLTFTKDGKFKQTFAAIGSKGTTRSMATSSR